MLFIIGTGSPDADCERARMRDRGLGWMHGELKVSGETETWRTSSNIRASLLNGEY